jgi:hypothetical protein
LRSNPIPSVRAMAGENERSGSIGPLEKILEIIGIEEPGKKLEKIFQVMNVKAGELNQGAFDIQKIYDELESRKSTTSSSDRSSKSALTRSRNQRRSS